MKNKSLAIFGMTSALLATSLVCSPHTMQVDAFDVTKQGNTQAQLLAGDTCYSKRSRTKLHSKEKRTVVREQH